MIMSCWTLEERLRRWREAVPVMALRGLVLVAAFLHGRLTA